MTASKPHAKAPSAEEIERIRAERAAKKAEKAVEQQHAASEQAHRAAQHFKVREWLSIPRNESSSRDDGRFKVSLLSWNALVRRDLFPGSDFLKVKDRVPTIMQEVLHYKPAIACMQEVDRLEDHLPVIEYKYETTFFKGYPNKSHGLLIAHDRKRFRKVGENGIKLDQVPLRQPTSTSKSGSSTDDMPFDSTTSETKDARRWYGISRSTRNVALFVALESLDQPGRGLIVGTTHLFWHPKHAYERVRQTALFVREAYQFASEQTTIAGASEWPVVLAGDFNFQPREASYRLLKGMPLSSELRTEIERSTVVHSSVDKLYERRQQDSTTTANKNGQVDPVAPEPATKDGQEDDEADEDEEDGEGGTVPAENDPDKVITNARPATDADGLASVDELEAMFDRIRHGNGVRSAYADAYGLVEGDDDRYYWTRAETDDPSSLSFDERAKRGDFEPKYTNYTPLWALTLDYIFVLPTESSVEVVSLLDMHKKQDLENGLPRKGISPSDHMAIAAELLL